MAGQQTGDVRAAARPALIIEDDAVIALDLQDMLENIGYAPVDMAHTPEEAEARAHNQYSIAIVDVKLELGDSSAAAHVLRKTGTPFVITTGYADFGDLSPAFQGAPRLIKPFDEADLRGAIQQALGKRAP